MVEGPLSLRCPFCPYSRPTQSRFSVQSSVVTSTVQLLFLQRPTNGTVYRVSKEKSEEDSTIREKFKPSYGVFFSFFFGVTFSLVSTLASSSPACSFPVCFAASPA